MLIRLFRIVQFSRSFLPPFRATWSLYHISADLSRGFLKFFKKLFFNRFAWLLSFEQLIYYITFFRFCQGVFQTFLKKSLLRSDIFRCAYLSATAYTLYHILPRKSTPFPTKYCTIWFAFLSTIYALSTLRTFSAKRTSRRNTARGSFNHIK